MHTDLEPYLLFADGEYGAIYRSNINASGIQQLVRGLSRPIALDFDYRYNASYIYLPSNFRPKPTWAVDRGAQ